MESLSKNFPVYVKILIWPGMLCLDNFTTRDTRVYLLFTSERCWVWTRAWDICVILERRPQMRFCSTPCYVDIKFKTGNFFRAFQSFQTRHHFREVLQHVAVHGAVDRKVRSCKSCFWRRLESLFFSTSLFFGDGGVGWNWLQKKAGCEPSSLNEKHVAGIQNSGVFQHGPDRHLFLVCTAESWSRERERGAGVERRW